jgi:hypothetical protein
MLEPRRRAVAALERSSQTRQLISSPCCAVNSWGNEIELREWMEAKELSL